MAFFDDGFDEEGEDVDLPNLLNILKQFGPVQAQMEPSAESIASNLGILPPEVSYQREEAQRRPTDFSSEMGRRQREDAGAGYPSPNANPPQNFSPEDIGKLNNAAEGWTGVPGTQSFRTPGSSGRFRSESGITPEGQQATAAADSLRSFNKSKYGGSGNYGGAGGEVMSRGESTADLGRQAYASGAGKRRELEGQVSGIEQMIQRALAAGGEQIKSPAFAELQQQLAGLKAMQSNRVNADTAALEGSTGSAAKFLAPLAEMDKADRQRQEYGALANMLNGKGGPNISQQFPSGMEKGTYDQVQKVISGQREERRLNNADRAFNATQDNRANVRTDRNNRPINPSAASVKLNMQRYLPPGTSIAKVAGQDALVKSGTTTPVPNGQMYINQAIQKAQAELSQRGGEANPAVVKHPAVRAVTDMLKAKRAGTLEPHQAILLKRFEENQAKIKADFMQKGMDERTASERALILAAGDVVGLR